MRWMPDLTKDPGLATRTQKLVGVVLLLLGIVLAGMSGPTPG